MCEATPVYKTSSSATIPSPILAPESGGVLEVIVVCLEYLQQINMCAAEFTERCTRLKESVHVLGKQCEARDDSFNRTQDRVIPSGNQCLRSDRGAATVD